MKKGLFSKNEKGFTLIEIIAVLVILGILAAFAIPKYIDMRKEAIESAARSAAMELSARERLALAQWKLQGCTNAYPAPDSSGTCEGTGILTATGKGIDTDLGADWKKGTITAAGGTYTFQGKTVTFTREQPVTATTPESDKVNIAFIWKVTSVAEPA
jgi:prepilin-type N-terminal cleavage/methylation domain-containing protein